MRLAGMSVLVALVLGTVRTLAGDAHFDVKQYGAAGDGVTMDTAAIQKTIDAAAAAGGGTVRFGPGRYLSGSIDLKSHVKLQLDKGATLLGSPRQTDYRRLNFHGLILAERQEDIGICGVGTIDGQGEALAADTVRLAKEGKLPDATEGKRPVIINFRDCRNVTVRDITLRNSACWVQEYRDCQRLTIENITVRSLVATNNDGIDIDGCAHVVVRNCDIDSEDDGICLKSGDKACDDVLVENCRVRSTCNALKFGTGSKTGFKNITCRNLDIYDTYISGIALEIVDGGVMENVNVSHIKITDTNNAIFVRLGHRNVDGPVGSLHGVTISDVTAQVPNRQRKDMDKFPKGWRHRCLTLITASITGQPGHPVKDVTLKDVSITYGGIGDQPAADHHRLDKLDKVPECAAQYPESRMFGVLPAWGIYCRHADGIKLDNVTLRVNGTDYRAAVVCDDVKDIRMDGLHVMSAGREPVIVLNDVHGAAIRHSEPPPKATAFIKTQGSTDNVKGP